MCIKNVVQGVSPYIACFATGGGDCRKLPRQPLNVTNHHDMIRRGVDSEMTSASPKSRVSLVDTAGDISTEWLAALLNADGIQMMP